jgi:acetyl-CoA synthetase
MSIVWRPKKADIERTNVYRFMQRLGISDREEFLRFSVDQLETFWAEIEKEMKVEWFTPYSKILDTQRGNEWAKWYIGGELNIAHNCLDRWLHSRQIACLWQNESGDRREVTFLDLVYDSNRLAHYLRSLGIDRGDRVALCVPMEPELLTVVYACLKIGAVVVPIFAGFGPSAIASRLADSGARVVFTAESLTRRGKKIPLRAKVDEALLRENAVEHVIHLDQIDSLTSQLSGLFETVPLPSDAPALLLYTSGTTGKPKGCVHTHGGALMQPAKEVYLAFDHQPSDRFFWLTDIGWMMGPWTILGNHHFGGTIFLYDGAPDYPEPNRLWHVLEQEEITVFGTSPTAIRMSRNISSPDDFALDSLRLLGSTGEPWDETSWLWFFENIGKRRCPIINISGGTEIIGCFLLPLPIQPLKPCTLGGPAPGMAVEVVDERGKPVRRKTGYLVCTKPAPSFTAGIWGEPLRYIDSYWARFPGWWSHGDWASVDEDGFWFLHGRADESMNVAGRKTGPAEVEDILCEHPGVAEAAVIGVPDKVKGEGIVAFVVARSRARIPLRTPDLLEHLVRQMGATFRPKEIHVVAELPKTQSGKIVRRLIRQKYLGEPLDETSTLANPESLRYILEHGV